MQNLDIAKFGGTSVANYEAMNKCVDVVTQNPDTKLVVVSACAGVTNLLVELASGAPDSTKREEIISQIFAIHKAISENLPDSERHEAVVNEYLSTVRDLSVQATMTRTDMVTDRLVSHGELMSSYLITEIFKQRGFKSVCFDVRQVMRTDSTYGKAVALVEVISTLTRQHLQPILDSGDTIVVTQGFIGADSSGQTTTLGRGGSDYSAALLGEACHASTISIWTDVPGVYTTDPRLVPEAMPISELTYLEAAEMATFGAKILHPSTLVPAVRCGIPVYVGSSKEPEKGGTWVRPTTDHSPSFRAVALRRNQTLIVLSSPKMVGATGFLAEVFSIFAKYRLSVDLVSTSEVSIAITLDAGSQTSGLSNIPEALFHELREFCHVKVESGLALVAVIGNNMARTPHITAEVFSSIDSYPVRMICYGASSHNLCFLVGESEAVEVLTHLHKSLLEH
ncbi:MULTISPECIES: lysine-sensitive aspartokinase 3 [unclassified Anaerobiospirillum]|uniref:lysine-sensitive aspartokinase 3 n=1 Tax=unclassified Anaerobiospirillum TaxID=2647410 RepID=UPI001FF2343F|nr:MULTISPECIES: lysine-sensitive aspartokinase 3 [unclassified Anaerobiospirillum]MCK0535990.1 lysine-sensitive aspartokinase 3 [Anaerobiospirillum sp. NML120511]MCK0540270.1 lysine-sensitive aspartokinase 3 [Anaerobiospirillum sp. NML02-A-032]